MLTKQRYIDTRDSEMTSYPNILTPPMDAPEYLVFSPKSADGSSHSSPLNLGYTPNLTHLNIRRIPDNFCVTKPYLQILEEPVDKFRFRYKSEMAGTHGSLNGRNSDRSRKQTFPCVKLQNYSETAIIRCSLYQIGRPEPHAHRLVKRQGPDEIDDPHDIEIGPDIGFIANFMNMGIIHTAKKFIVSELVRKYSVMKREDITRHEGIIRALTKTEEMEVKQRAEGESNHIKLNQVCLRFEAFRKDGNALFPICSSAFSGTINNLKSAETGELKIVRMDHCTSSSRGGREVFILVDKVTKKNIKVRFFELDEDGSEIWCDYGKFSDLDVHHQYAIVFKTPPYRTIDIDKQVKVYIELQRPSDGARSDPKDFTYTPCEIIQGRKRARTSCSSYSGSSSFSSREFPTTLPNPDFIVNSKDLEDALMNNNMDSEEVDRLCGQLVGIQPLYTDASIAMDAPLSFRSPNCNKPRSTNITADDTINRVQQELEYFFTSLRGNSTENSRVKMMLENTINNQRYKSQDGNTILHLLILKNNYKQDFLLYVIKLLHKYELPSIINLRNQKGQTALHLAVYILNKNVIKLLLDAKADRSIQDLNGNTPVHFAIMKEAPDAILNLLLSCEDASSFINSKNNEGNTALHLAVKMNNLSATHALCDSMADIDLPSDTNGYTPLHMAVADQNKDIITFLLESGCDTGREDYSGSNAIKLANVLIDNEIPTTTAIYKIVESHMKALGLFDETLIKEEDHMDETSEETDGVKDELSLSPDDDDIDIKYEEVSYIPEECLQKVCSLLLKSGSWRKLAERLHYGHMTRANIFDEDHNPAKSFFDFILANGETVAKIRSCLEALNEHDAVKILDNSINKGSLNT